MFEIRPLEISDIPEVVKGWNQVLVYDRVSEDQFKRIVLDDPNYERDLNLVVVKDERIVGFVSAAARESILGRDGRGRLEEIYDGYIKGLYVLNDHSGSKIGEDLLNKVLKHLKSKGKRVVKIVEYTGRYFFPGIDVRYVNLLRLFDENGFKRVYKLHDVAIDLKDFKPTEYQKRAERRVLGMGIKITTYKPEMLGLIREFVKKLNIKQWFPRGWENAFGKDGYTLIAIKGDKILG